MSKQQSNQDQFTQRFIEFFSKYVESHSASTRADYKALEAEKDNILQAIDLAYKSKNWEHVLRLVRVIGRQPHGFLDARGYWAESLHCYDLAIKAARRLNNKGDQGAFTLATAMIIKKQGELPAARKKTQQAYIILKDVRGKKEELSDVIHELGMQALDGGDVKESEKIHLENLKLRRRISYMRGIAYSTHELGRLARIRGDFESAKQYLEESLRIRESFKDDVGAPSPTLHDLGCAELGEAIKIHKLESFSKARPHYTNAKRYLERSLKLKKLLGMQSPISNTLHEMGRLVSFNGQYEKAEEYLRESLKISEALHQQAEISHRLFALAENEYERGNLVEAERLCRETTDLRARLRDKRGMIACNYLSALIAEKQGDIKKAVRLLESVYKAWTKTGQWQAELALSKLNQLKESKNAA